MKYTYLKVKDYIICRFPLSSDGTESPIGEVYSFKEHKWKQHSITMRFIKMSKKCVVIDKKTAYSLTHRGK